ncbi:myosin light chain kinase, smooth muscle-like isoform X1 [Lates japonicus]|uniref:Myosin light chain kinase, smooth muscle-like isoform X1 n=1 Tax=Lates japonicus TaxID=270547 RepID=A0AAD3M860_LATJO|nr:myosin light chain kinase, smooth muscle-like isoform X1 [Lates japonicus]
MNGDGSKQRYVSTFRMQIKPPRVSSAPGNGPGITDSRASDKQTGTGSLSFSPCKYLDPPVFIEPLEDCSVDEGSDITLRVTENGGHHSLPRMSYRVEDLLYLPYRVHKQGSLISEPCCPSWALVDEVAVLSWDMWLRKRFGLVFKLTHKRDRVCSKFYKGILERLLVKGGSTSPTSPGEDSPLSPEAEHALQSLERKMQGPPQFTQTLEDRPVAKGSSASHVTSGYPDPELVWLCGEEPIVESHPQLQMSEASALVLPKLAQRTPTFTPVEPPMTREHSVLTSLFKSRFIFSM